MHFGGGGAVVLSDGIRTLVNVLEAAHYGGTGRKYCHTALNSARQNSSTAYATGPFSVTPAKAVRQTLRPISTHHNMEGRFLQIRK
jgi:hypothetical protein